MRTTRSNPVIMPNGEQGEQTSREFAMNGQMRPDNAMPIFHRTTGADGLIPGSQKVRGDCSPSRLNALQQVLAGWTKHGPTQPCSRQQSDRLRSQDSRGLLLYRIKSSSKQQGLRQSQTNLLRKHLKLPLQCQSGRWHQLIQQIQHGDDLALTVFTGEQAIRQRDDHFQQGVQFLTEIAHSISDIAHLGKARLLLGQRCFGMPASSSYPVCERIGVPLDGEQTILFCLHGSIQTPLDLSGHMEEMPDISLVVLLPMNLTQGFLDRSASITDGAQPADSLFLQIPQQQRPTFSIDLHRGHAGPHLPAVDINHIQIGFSALAAVLFIQGQGARSSGQLVTQPRLSTLPGFFDDANNPSQAHINPMQFSQTRLNAPITGMRFDQQRQNHTGNRLILLRWHELLSQSFFQCLPSCCCPTVQGLTRYSVRTTQLTHLPMYGVRQHLTDHAHSLLNSATMVHGSSRRTVVFFTSSPYLSGSLFVNFARQLSHWFTLTLNHALRW